MSAIQAANVAATQPAARISGSHGYRIDGDVARINALIEAAGESGTASEWALQLWACDQPFSGGRISGTKVAELRLAAPLSGGHPLMIEGEAPARLPPGGAEHAMTLVLAAGHDGHTDVIHDYANYVRPERFNLPRLGGSVGYRFAGSQVEISADAVENPRETDNLSGTLALELRAVAADGVMDRCEGVRVAGVVLGTLPGQGALHAVAVPADAAAIPEGIWNLIVELREWTAAGYQTRDFRVMPRPYVVAPARVEPPPDVVTVESVAPDGAESGAVAQPAAPASAAPAERTTPVTELVAEPAAPASAVPAERTTPVTVLVAERAAPASAASSGHPPAAGAAGGARAAAQSASAAAAGATHERRVSVNRAREPELAAVKGMSRPLAKAIVAGRPYASMQELLDVKGMGPKLLAKLRDQLSL